MRNRPKKTEDLTEKERKLLCLEDGRRIYKYICICLFCKRAFASDNERDIRCPYPECIKERRQQFEEVKDRVKRMYSLNRIKNRKLRNG